MNKETMEMQAMMETIVASQVTKLQNRFALIGMKILVSERKITLVRERNVITELVSTMGIHAALTEINFDYAETVTDIGEDHPEIAKLQRKLMALTILARIGEFYSEVIRDKKDSNIVDTGSEEGMVTVLEKMRTGMQEIIKDRPSDKLAAETAALAKRMAGI